MRIFISYCSCLIATVVTGTGFVTLLRLGFQGEAKLSTWIIFVVAYCAMATGVTVGFHRYGVHRAFAFTAVGKWTVRPLLLLTASCAMQSSMWFWCTAHRKHHYYTDEQEDPHSPHSSRDGWWQKAGQFLWAHMFWVPYFHSSDWKKFCQWKNFDWFEKAICWFYLPIVVTPLLIIWLMFEWQGLTAYLGAIFLFWHVTSAVNSVTHSFGWRQHKTGDKSTNIWPIAWLSFGEFLHNAHHASQKSARFARAWYEWLVDWGWLQIYLMNVTGLVHKVITPNPAK